MVPEHIYVVPKTVFKSGLHAAITKFKPFAMGAGPIKGDAQFEFMTHVQRHEFESTMKFWVTITIDCQQASIGSLFLAEYKTTVEFNKNEMPTLNDGYLVRRCPGEPLDCWCVIILSAYMVCPYNVSSELAWIGEARENAYFLFVYKVWNPVLLVFWIYFSQ